MKRIAKRIIRSQAGLSFTELLATIIILLLATTVVAAGLPAARNAYERVVVGSNAQVLLSTTVARLREELGSAESVEPDASDPQAVIYQSGETGFMRRITQSDEENVGIMVNMDDDSAMPLVSQKASTELHVEYDGVAIRGDNNNIIEFTGLKVVDDKDPTHSYVELGELCIRVTALSAD